MRTNSWSYRAGLLTIAFGVLLAGRGALPSAAQNLTVTRRVIQIQRADYEGDRATLKQDYDDLANFADDQQFGAKISYWRGFALWRRALNGFNDKADPAEIEADLRQAVVEFNRSAAKDPSFADAKIGAGSCLVNIAFLHQKDPAQVREPLTQAIAVLKEATAQDPDNPRLLWVQGANRWYMPANAGGGQDQAIETYKKGLLSARERGINKKDVMSPQWGLPELLMNLAWSYLNQTKPDLDAAEASAKAALAYVPYWHYVRDILLPQIEAAKKKNG